jgi:hypothetical protein
MTQRTITIQELVNDETDQKEIEEEKNEVKIKKMTGPKDGKRIENKYIRPVHVSKIAVLVFVAIILQALLNTNYVKLKTGTMFPNKWVAKIVPIVVFLLIIGGLFYFTIQ